MTTSKNAQLIQGLRDLLAFVEANSDFEFVPGNDSYVVELGFRTWYISGEEKQRFAIADLTRRMARFGKVEKLYSDDYAWLRLPFGSHVRLEVSMMRKTICERVVVGKKVIAAQPERFIAATAERTEEEVEWRCHPVMTAGSSHTIDGTAELAAADEPLQLEAEHRRKWLRTTKGK